MKIKRTVVGGLTVMAAVFAGGCGGANSPQSIQSQAVVSQSQALAITSDLFAAMASAPLVPGGIALTAHSPDVAARIRNAQLGGTPAADSVVSADLARPELTSINTIIPSYTFNCPMSGTIVVSGSFSGTDNETAVPPSISVSENVVETINHCVDSGITFNGNPNITVAANVALANYVFTDSTTISGAVLVNNTNCPINVSVTASYNENTNAESGLVSGSICGVSINATL